MRTGLHSPGEISGPSALPPGSTGAASASSHPLTPRSPECDENTLVGAMRDWLQAAQGHVKARGGAWPAAARGRLELALVDGFVRRGAKYFPGCQRALCAAVPRAAAAGCRAAISEGMYPGPAARTPAFWWYLNAA